MNGKFSSDRRIVKTDDFSSVFALRKQRSRLLLQVLQSENNGFEHARLGLVVSKKAAKRANARNYMKRVIREWFRLHRHELPPHDFVVRVRQRFDRSNAADARTELAQLMRVKK